MSFWCVHFLPKTNEKKSTSSNVEFVRSFFGRNDGLKKSLSDLYGTATKSYICKWIIFAISSFAKIKKNPFKLYCLAYRRPTVQDVPCNCTIGLVVLGMYTKVRWVVEFITRGYISNKLEFKDREKRNIYLYLKIKHVICKTVSPTWFNISQNTNSPFRWFWILTVRVYPMFFHGNWNFQNSWL